MLVLNALDELDDNMFLFTSDETAMCPNMKTEELLMFLTLALNNLIFKVEPNWPRTDVINAIKLLLRFNVFQFECTCYRKNRVE